MNINQDYSIPITAQMIDQAKENIIQRRETHLDQLVDKLKEKRVQQVIEPLLKGDTTLTKIPNDHILYAKDLGLITIHGQIRIANPIYQEVIPRELTFSTQVQIAQESAWYIQDDGQLDIIKLLTAFQQFFREHSEHWVERFDYKEAGPQLLLQAFLQRIINGGGRVERVYGLGRKRTDLLLLWPYLPNTWPGSKQGVQRVVLELKLLHKTLEKTIEEGLAQTHTYMDTCNTDDGHLIIFDRTPNKTWDDKLFQRKKSYRDKTIIIWGM